MKTSYTAYPLLLQILSISTPPLFLLPCFFGGMCYHATSNMLFCLMTLSRSSHRICSVRKVVLRNFAKLTGKHLCRSLFLNKDAGLRPATLFKKRLRHRCFPVNFAKFLRVHFLQNTFGRLLLVMDLNLLCLGILTPPALCCVFYATVHQIYWTLDTMTCFLIVLWFDISHTGHTAINKVTHTYKCILTAIMWTQQLPLLPWMSNLLIQKFNLQRSTSLLLKSYSLAEVIYSLIRYKKTKSFLTQRTLIEMI